MTSRSLFSVLLLIGPSLLGCAAKRYSPLWPGKGSVVYVSTSLYHTMGQFTSEPLKDAPGLLPELPACEAVEVLRVRPESLRVRDGQGRLFEVSQSWETVVHATVTKCLDTVRQAKRKQPSPSQ